MLYTLPSITEQVFSSYIAANYQGSYNINKSFQVADLVYPMILVKAGKFKELEPETGLYEGNLIVAVMTQIDDVQDPLTAHDSTLAAIYDLMRDRSALLSFVNDPSGRFHLHGYYESLYDQEADQRELKSVLEFVLSCQTLAL